MTIQSVRAVYTHPETGEKIEATESTNFTPLQRFDIAAQRAMVAVYLKARGKGWPCDLRRDIQYEATGRRRFNRPPKKSATGLVPAGLGKTPSGWTGQDEATQRKEPKRG